MNIESKIQQLLQKSITEKDKRKRMLLFHEISILNDYAILFEQKDFRILQRKYYRKEDYLFSKKENLKNQKIFLQSFHLEREYHQIFTSFTISNCYDSSIQHKSFYLKETMPEKLFFQILLDFFEEKLPEFNSFFLKLLEENRIFFTKNKELFPQGSIGVTKYLPSSFKSLIFVWKEYSVKNLITVVHEVGHAIHFDFIKDNYLSFAAGYFSELFPYFLEQVFVDYLKEKNLFRKECNRYLDSLAVLLFNKANELYILSNLSHFTVDPIYDVQTSNEEIYEELKEHLSKEVTPSQLKQLNLRNCLLYYYGILFSYAFFNQYKQNPKETLKNLKTVLTMKDLYTLQDLFGSIPFDIDSFLYPTFQKQMTVF